MLDEHGVSSFARLKAALGDGAAHRLVFYAFDLLHLDGQDLRDLPLLERKRQLEQLLAPLPPDHLIRFCDHLIGSGPEMHRNACRLGVEGIIAKRVDAPYRSGRSGDWLKIKCHARQEFVIGGYTTVKNRGFGLGSLAPGRPAGWRAGLCRPRRHRLGHAHRPEAARCTRSAAGRTDRHSPVCPTAARRGAHWVRPELVAEVRFQTWTADGLLRHASFQGLREDQAGQRDRRGAAGPRASPSSSARPSRSQAVLELHGVRISSADRPVLDRPA